MPYDNIHYFNSFVLFGNLFLISYYIGVFLLVRFKSKLFAKLVIYFVIFNS